MSSGNLIEGASLHSESAFLVREDRLDPLRELLRAKGVVDRDERASAVSDDLRALAVDQLLVR